MTNRFAVFVAALLLIGCASMRPQADLNHIAFIGTAAGDTITSVYAIEQGAAEANPLYGTGEPAVAALVGVKVAGWFVLRWVENKMPENRWMRTLLWAPAVALASYSIVHNIRLGRSLAEGDRR